MPIETYLTMQSKETNIMTKFSWLKRTLYFYLLPTLLACTAPGLSTTTIRESAPQDIRAFFKSKNMDVVTFLGYSGAEYENKALMLEQASQILDRYEPAKTIVNIGATPEGIGAVYEIAKRKGFMTSGIISTQAQKTKVTLSPFVDVVFYVKDDTWGGFLPGTEKLSPTSAAMVENSDVLAAIGGGEVARDELIAATRLGKRVQFIPADMNHRIALKKALKKAQPAPTDFRGAAATLY